MENTKINEFYSKQILDVLSNYSFDSNIFDDNFNIASVARTLDAMCYEISKRKPSDLNIKMATDVARRMNISEDIVTANNSKSSKSFNDALDEENNHLKNARNYEKRLCLEVAFLLVFNFYYKDQNIPDMYETIEELIERYNEFKNIDNDKELKLLLTFRNVMKIAQKVVPAKNNKTFLLDVVTRIAEGKDAKYITGSGQTAATARRVQIYEREGGITAQARPPRKLGYNVDGLESYDDILILPEKRKYATTEILPAAYTSLSSSSSSAANLFSRPSYDFSYMNRRTNMATLDVLAALSAGLPSVSVNTEEILSYMLDIDTTS